MKKNLSLRGGVWLERVKIFEEFVATLLSSFNKPGKLEMFYLHSILNFGIPPVLIFQLEVYYKVDRLLTIRNNCLMVFK